MSPIGAITSFIGVNIRYLAYKFIGKPKTKKQLRGDDEDALSKADQHFVNSTIIQYNSLNLPTLMDIKSPVGEARNEYTYSASGQKLKVIQKWNPNFNTNPVIGSGITTSVLTASLTTDYVGNKIYENGTLKRILIDGGYIENNKYYYYLMDHLGNNRIVAEAAGTPIQKTHYYPFGMAYGESTGGEKQPYKYNGKELDTKHGLNMYDYSARYMDPAIGRFTSIDPLAEKYYSISPYVYVANNPMKYVDYRGDSISVAEEHRTQFQSDLKNTFGSKASSLTFNSSGNLVLAGKEKDFTKGMTKDQKNTYKGLKKAMNDKQTTSVVYADNHNLTVEGQTKSVDVVKEFGGGLYSKTDNIIVIAPSVGTVNVTLDDISKATIANGTIQMGTQNVQQNTTSTLFHEIGERNTNNIHFRGGVIDYENHARKVVGLPKRPYDLNHSKIVKTNYKK